jgi:undecaprenyl-diphosphatase
VTNLIKFGVGRVRPAIDPLAGFSGDSFPSGHSASAAATFAACALLLGRRQPRWLQCTLTGVAGGLAVGVASSRVLLGVHWLTDVIAGLALGWGWFALSAVAFGGRMLHFGAPVELGERAVDLREAAPTAESPDAEEAARVP